MFDRPELAIVRVSAWSRVSLVAPAPTSNWQFDAKHASLGFAVCFPYFDVITAI